MEPPADSAPGPTLASIPPGLSARILSVADGHRATLDREGLRPGATVSVETAMPLGGPIVVRLGHARVALARGVAARVGVQPLSPEALAEVAELAAPAPDAVAVARSDAQ